MSQTLLVNKDDFAEVAYMLTGDQIGYWHYFNPSDYDIQMDETDGIKWGRMPVWGYGEVTQSLCADVEVGQIVYGFFPIMIYSQYYVPCLQQAF